ncbi:Uncharacterised protein [Streptococcus pneumoniae]|uniref:Uncharacterized protein n=3 Tax=Bacillus cereus group TaxID=86661 RepID=A0A161SZC5_BACCE|nr:hypothetical protein FORC13_3911 [Bacillus cereus]KKZ97499.1 hypothetical protein B4147_3026 [Bacillus wiedmannii]CDN34628.1 unnamed protein product [Bacillus thuringiensis DB27]CGF97755.1 Uncharacterised protein [Streptococcus pneumoniae]AQQ62021.1 hypothetical Protein FORC21_1226 [Bacillus cereus]
MNKLHFKEVELEELNSKTDIIYWATGAVLVAGQVIIIT